MLQAVRIKRELFSTLSWRAEAWASGLSPDRGQRVRDRMGHLMRWTRAHDCLPDVQQRAAILCFHGVIGHTPDADVECEHLPVEGFREILRLLNRSFRVIELAELVAAIQDHRSPPPRSVVITFDDGYANNAEVAAEELAKFNIPWSAFLPAQLVETGSYQWIDDVRLLVHQGGRSQVSLSGDDGPVNLDLSTTSARHAAVQAIHHLCRYVPDEIRRQRLAMLYEAYPQGTIEELRERFRSFAPMTWDQARQLKAAGVDVGSHSLTHTALGPQSIEVIRHEIFAARELMQARIGDHSRHFSYPYGRNASMSDQTEAVLTEAGYTCALTLEQDAVRCDQVNLMQLPRLIISSLVGRTLFSLWQRFIR